uniref:Odorant receptor n=1 Tax=Mythimna loreyi TaxID=667449 RepID=A0AAU6ND82_9NEOP
MEIQTSSDLTPKKKYEGFNETFKLCAFSLAFAFLYPNRNTALKRCLIITAIIVFCGVQLFWFIAYTFKCLYTLDIYNFARNMTLAVVLVLFFVKTYYVIYATPKFAPLLDKISEDLLEANNLEEDFQKLYDDHIKIARVGEISWLVIPTFMSALFPIYAGSLMTIESIQSDDYKRRMVHDMELLFVEHIQSETPFFQCMFAYNCVQCVVLVPNYCGFDGSFCIATTHLRLKLKLLALKVEKAFKHSRSRHELRMKVNESIRNHQDALDFYVQLQNVYGPWLFAVFLLTSFMISFNLYQIYLLKRIDPKYTSFGVVGVLHIFLPCYYASELTRTSEETPEDFYLVEWETWADNEVTKLLIFMITRAQKEMIVSGMGLVIFNMELFKSILQTSFSFFNLITA